MHNRLSLNGKQLMSHCARVVNQMKEPLEACLYRVSQQLTYYQLGVEVKSGQKSFHNNHFLSGANQACQWFELDFENGSWWKDPGS